MRHCDPFGHFQPAKVPVVIVQAAELQSETRNRARQLDNHVAVSLLDAGAIHAGIDVEENSHSAAAPLPHLFFVFGEGRNAHARKLIGDFAHAERICAYRWISKEHVSGAAAASHKKFECGSAFEISNAALDQNVQGKAQFGGLDVYAQAIRVVPQEIQGALDVGDKNLRIQHESRRQQFFNGGNAVARIPGEFTQHGFLRSHFGFDDSA